MLNQSLAKAIFVSGSPLSMVEHPLWIDFFKRIRPSFQLPSRYRLSSTYLDAQYTETQGNINKQLEEAKNLHLQCDGWSNLKNESIINFIISKPEPIFVEFVMTNSNSHNAEYLAQLITNLMEKYGPEKFLVAIGDNAANMKAALNLVKVKFPHIVPLGCLAHLLNLLCSDILGCQTIKIFMANAVEVVKTVKHSHILQALFDEISAEKKFKDRISLKFPGKTRWGSHLFCLESLQSNKVVLQTLVVNEKAQSYLKPEIKKRVLDDDVFWVRVDKMIELMNPIVHLITAFESNKPQVHKIAKKFNELEAILIEKLPSSPLQSAEEKAILAKFQARKEFGVSSIHLAANLLDPAAQGSNLKPIEMLDAISFVCDTAKNTGLDVVQVRENLADYRDKQGIWSRQFVWEGVGLDEENRVNPLLWWRGLRGTCELVEVAIKILGAPVTSAATERTFSTFGWIHSKKRNRLTSERAAKLTYLAYNWKLMHGTPKLQKKTEQSSPESFFWTPDKDKGGKTPVSNEEQIIGLEFEESEESEPELHDTSSEKSDEDQETEESD